MPARKSTAIGAVQARIRVLRLGTIALGPGKVDLLEALVRTGSLAEAAREMGMSYMRVWSLVRTMNEAFREPLVATRRGGDRRGGASLTPTGERVLRLYRRMEARTLQAIEPDVRALRKLLREP